MIDSNNIKSTLDQPHNRLKLMFIKIWYRDMQYGLEEVSLEVKNISLRYVTVEKIIKREDHQYADIIQSSLLNFDHTIKSIITLFKFHLLVNAIFSKTKHL